MVTQWRPRDRRRPIARGTAAASQAVAATLRRSREIELGSCALVLASQQLMCTIPLLVVLAAFRLFNGTGNFGTAFAGYLGLSAPATSDLRAVFAGAAQVRTTTTVGGVLLLVLFTIGTARAHQRGYELAWRLEAATGRGLVRQGRWIAGLIGYVIVLATLSYAVGMAPSRHAVAIALSAPASMAFYWWSQYLLLGGRVSARALLPGAVFIALGITLLLEALPGLLSAQIASSVKNLGLFGVTYTLATWQLVLSIFILGGATLGAALANRRRAT